MSTREVATSGALCDTYTEVFLPDTRIQVLTLTPSGNDYLAIVVDLNLSAATTLILPAEQILEVQA